MVLPGLVRTGQHKNSRMEQLKMNGKFKKLDLEKQFLLLTFIIFTNKNVRKAHFFKGGMDSTKIIQCKCVYLC